MQRLLELTCAIKNQQTVLDPTIVKPWLIDLVAQGYRLVAATETIDSFNAWWHIHRPDRPARRLTPAQEKLLPGMGHAGITEQLQADINAFFLKKSGQLKLCAYHTENTLEFTLRLSLAPLCTLAIEVEREYLAGTYDGNGIQAYKQWLAAIKLTYNHLHPFYASIYDTLFAHEPSTKWVDAFQGYIHNLSLVNIFGPDLVRRFGRERLLTTPAWRCEKLDDGGILLLPEPYWYGYIPAWKQASEHLGVSTAHYRYVAHVASLLQQYNLLSNLTVAQLAEATAQSCVFEMLKVLLPDHFVPINNSWKTEKELSTIIQRYADLTQGEWQPRQIKSIFEKFQTITEFNFQGQRIIWNYNQIHDRQAIDVCEFINEFAQQHLQGCFLNIHTHVLYLPKGVATALHELFFHLKSGWPNQEELGYLFPQISPEDWEFVLAGPNKLMEFSDNYSSASCCDAQRIEQCKLVRYGLTLSANW
ncbi:hypothetical protein KDW_63820 [Dictyobacter vulcani]|uniref:Uncharacterized protein n=1 Tax=Dictyobacter vulcani TaxID=2607529 RepID=A0A5J4L073_9CHLR|nr:hypothetical protein [Dictyobacter vulcani]GER92220.1 hypothetical protein KDW_63820 [Dictyobacter vulcani]